MIKLGITGNIAAGKTLIESFLNDNGVKTVDADRIVHELLEKDQKIIEKISKLFLSYGIDVKEDGISRKKAGKAAFENPEILKGLEKILHPEVKKNIQKFFSDNKNEDIIAAIIPLLYEAKMEGMFDYVVLVTADEKTRLERILKRNPLSQDEAIKRINAQMPQEEKINRADFVLDNSTTPEQARSQLVEVLNKIKN